MSLRILLLAIVLTLAGAATAAPADDVKAGLAARSAGARDDARRDFERASQGDDSLSAAEALYHLADMDEDDLAFASALDLYRACLGRAPASRYAPRASTRIDYLRRHAEGDFAPLVRLERIRRDTHSADGPTIDALARDADAFPPGLVRVEARLVVADAYQRRLGRPDDAVRVYRLVLADDKADPMTQELSAQAVSDILSDEGDFDGALEAAQTVEAYDPSLAEKVRRLARRARLRRGSKLVLATLALMAGFSIALSLLRRDQPALGAPVVRYGKVALPFAIWLGAVGGFLAVTYEGGSMTPFFGLAAAILVVALVARAWSAVGSPKAPARIARALLCAAAIVAAAFVVLDRIDAAYLDSFGL